MHANPLHGSFKIYGDLRIKIGLSENNEGFLRAMYVLFEQTECSAIIGAQLSTKITINIMQAGVIE
jgi:hypothetical protein